MKNFLKRSPVSSLSIFLILLSITVSVANLLNQGFYFKKENVDLPNAAKKLVVDTIKNEISFNAKCIHENCKKEVRNLENVLDEISYANQLGRLDTISLILAIFGLVLGFGAVAGFMHIKEVSQGIAKTETESWLEKNAERIANKAVDNAVRNMIENMDLTKEAKIESKKERSSESYENL